MRYDDASQAGSTGHDSAPVAHADVAATQPGGYGASGNAITGAGTISGAAGADAVADGPARVVEVHGAGGATTESGSSFQAAGQYGVLTMDAQGNFNYARNPNTPEGVQDVFGYTIADRNGATSSTTLTMGVGPAGPGTDVAAAAAAAGVVNLPPGVEMSDIHVNGRDLVINMPDGTQMVIPGGAVFVPQLVIGDVEVPANNLAALLVDSEPKPAAGGLQSSGGNFANPVPPLDPGVPLGDLIPPTELTYVPPEFHEVNDFLDDEPEIVIIPDGQPAAVNAVDSVDEAGLPARGGEPEGSGEELAAGADGDTSEHTSGVISIDAKDGIDSVTINGVEVTGVVGQQIAGDQGVLTITSVNFATGQIGYTYLLTDNTNPGGDNISDLFTVTVTDSDGDTATGTLTIDIIDDTPIARDDTDSLGANVTSTDGNVITGVGTTNNGADTQGADGVFGQTNDNIDGVTGIHAGTTGSFVAVAQNGTDTIVQGQFGFLSIDNDGNYTYTRTDFETETGGNDVFTYQITDGDGDSDTATLTISVPGIPDTVPEVIRASDSVVDEDGLQNANVDSNPLQTDPDETDSTESATATGSILVDYKSDVPGNLLSGIHFINPTSLNGQLETPDGTPITFTIDGSGNLVGSDGTNDVIVISITGATPGSGGQVTYTYEVDLLGPVQHLGGTELTSSEDTISLTGIQFEITDSDGDHASGSFNVAIVDDVPTAGTPDTEGLPTLVVDESPIGQDEGGDNDPAGVRTATADFSGHFGTPVFGADGEGSTTYALHLNGSSLGSGLYALDNTDTTAGDGDGIGQGDEIMLVDNGDGTISGVVNGTEYFTISVDENTGEVTFEQTANVWHADPTSDDDTSFLSADPGTITLVQTITDGDGDTDSASLDLSDDIFQIEDDGPTGGNPDPETLPTLTVDESPIGQDEGGDNDPAGVRTATADFSGAFGGSGAVGTDGLGSVTYTLSLHGSDLGSGLYALDSSDTTAGDGDGIGQGDEIMLVDNGDGTISGMANGTEYFVISVDENTGEVTFEQTANVWHGDTGSDDDTSSLVAQAGTITLDQVITDADGDSDSSSIDLSDGIFNIEDDGPTAATPDTSDLPTLVVDESPLGQDEGGDNDPAGVRTATADFSSAFVGGDAGTDGLGSVLYSLHLNGSNLGSGLYALDNTDTTAGDGDGIGQGDEIMLVDNGDGTISGMANGTEYFVISVDENTGEVTFEQTANVWHADPTSDDDTSSLDAADGTITLVQTITDADGDSDSASIDLSNNVFNIEDDGPTASTPDGSELPTLVVDESPLGEDEGGDNDPAGVRTATADFSGAFSGSDAGTDGLGSVLYALSLHGSNLGSGLYALDNTDTTTGDGDGYGQGDEIMLVDNGDGTISGMANGTEYFGISVDENTGEVTFEQTANVWHSDTANDDDTSSLVAAAGTITLDQIVTDADGDTDTASVDLSDGIFNIEDDGPYAIEPDSITTTDEPQSTISASLDLPDNDVTDNFGTDGPGTITFANIADGDDSGLESGGDPIIYWLSDDGQTLEGRTGSTDGTDGTLIFAVHIDQANSEYDYTQYETIDNGSGITFNDLSGGVAGNPPFKLITEPGETLELLATPINGGSINSDQDDMGVDSQFIDTTAGTDKGIRIDFGDFTYVPNQGGTADDQFEMESHSTVNGFKFTVVQVSNGTTADIHLVAYDANEDGGVAEQTPNPSGDTVVSITSVKIYDDNGNLVGTFTSDGAIGSTGATIDFITTDPNHVTVTIDDLPAEYSVETFTANGYDRIEITNPGNDATGDTDGKFSIGLFQISQTDTGDPINLNYDLQITDADGDSQVISDAINITLDPAGSQTLTTLASTSSLITDDSSSLSLLSSNDNDTLNQRAFNAGNNAALMGALAASGLGATSAAAASHSDLKDSHDSVKAFDAKDGAVHDTHQLDQGSAIRESFLLGDSQTDDPKDSSESSGSNSSDQSSDHSVSDGDSASGAAVSELAQGEDNSGGSDASVQSVFTSQAVVMPGAELLAAAGKGGDHGKGVEGQAASVEGQQHNQVVSQVLADALSGGHHGPDLDALVNAVSQHGGHHAGKGLEALASHGAGGVPNGDMAVFAAFTGHGMHAMDPMTMHQDAAPSNG